MPPMPILAGVSIAIWDPLIPSTALAVHRTSHCEDGNPPGEKMRFSGIYSPERSARHSAVVYGRTVTSSIVFDVFFPTTFTE